MDLSQLTTEDLQALHTGDLSKVSTAGLQLLHGGVSAAPSNESSRGVGDFLSGALQTAGAGIVNAVPAAINAGSDIVHRWGGNDSSAPVVGNIVQLGQAGQRLAHGFTNAPHLSIDELRAFQQPGDEKLTDDQLRSKFEQTYNGSSTLDDVLPQRGTVAGDLAHGAVKVGQDAASLAGGVGVVKSALALPGQVANAARGVGEAMSGNGFDVAEEPTAADAGLKAPSKPPLQPHQQVGQTITAAEAGVPKGTPLTPEAYEAGRVAPNAVVKRAANATPVGPLNKEELSRIDNIGGSGVPISGQGSIANINGLRANLRGLLSAPELSGQQKFDWLQALRTKGYKNSASLDPGATELGDAQLDAARVLEDHIERTLPKDADVDIDQFRAARTALAKNHTAEAVTKGGTVDMAALGRIYQRNPNLLTGGLGMLGRFSAENPELVGMGNRFQEPVTASGLDLTKPATWLSPVQSVAGRIMANRQAASGVQAASRAFPGTPPERFAPIDRTPQPPPGMTASTPTAPPPAPAGRPGDIGFADLLSHGVEQSPPAGLSLAPEGAPPSGGLPFTRNADFEATGTRHVPKETSPFPLGPARRLSGAASGTPIFSSGPELSLDNSDSWFTGGAPKGLGNDLAGVMSSNVPAGTLARTPPRAGGPRLGDTLAAPGTPQLPLGKPPGQAFTPGQRGLFNGGAVENNGSSPGAGGADSLEAQSRLSQEKSTGSQPFRIDPEGSPQPIAHTVDAVDQSVPKGHLKVQRDPSTGKLSIMDRGGMTLQAARGLLNRYLALHPPLGDDLGS